MTHLRRVLLPLGGLWLACQIAGAVALPVSLWMAAGEAHAVECACGHARTATCPMHHGRASQQGQCAMRAANASPTAVLTHLLGVVGPPVAPAALCRPVTSSLSSRLTDAQSVRERSVTPELPPPRL